MKKLFFLSAVLILAPQAISAQSVAMTDRIGEGAVEVLPKELTSSKAQSLMQVYNFRNTKAKSDLMIAASREDIRANIEISNAENAHEYWLKNVGGNWVADDEHTYFYIPYTNPLLSFHYQDPDNSFYPTAGILASQNIFNSDDNWEYVLLDIENKEKEEVVDNYFWDGVQSKYVEQTKTIKGYKIYNQNGLIVSFPIAELNNENKYVEDAYGYNLAKFGDLLYMTTIEMVRRTDDHRLEEAVGMYVFSASTTKVISASRTTANRVSVSGGNGAYNIKVENANDGEKVIITDMSGRTIGSAPASEGLSFQSNSTGIYNITLSGDNVKESLKFLGK